MEEELDIVLCIRGYYVYNDIHSSCWEWATMWIWS